VTGEFTSIGKRVPRSDGRQKATGAFRYMTDIPREDRLYGALVHPRCSHALVDGIDVSGALACPGVVRVVTAKDVPGLNRHGLIWKDQPVFCDRVVRYSGDTLADVIAVTPEIALRAAALVRVSLSPLPEVLTPEEALAQGAPAIHDGGNLAAEYSFAKGDVADAFSRSDVIVEETFLTPYQEHAYLETEGGAARPLPGGGVEIWEGCQNGIRAARDLALILNVPEERVIVHSHPLGGGFGGKDDLTLQGILAVCAHACGKPVQIDFSREESFLVSPKRMPMKIRMKMGATWEGKLLAISVHLLGTCGAYACYGPAIMSLALEHACGFYLFPHVEVAGELGYTNNSLVSAFRGFGNVQVNFAVESMMDMVAEKLGMDPVAFRRMNALRPGVRTSYGYLTSPSVYADGVLGKLEETELWRDRESFRQSAPKPWLKRGVGMAACFQGVGLGNHCFPDSARARVDLREDGTFLIAFSNEDMGQGNVTTLQMMAAESLKVPLSRIEAVCGISGQVPESGATTASKTTYLTGKAVLGATEKLLAAAGKALGCGRDDLVLDDGGANGRPWSEIYALLPPGERSWEGSSEFQYVEERYDFGVHYVYAYLSQVAGVEVNTLTGEVRVLKTEMIPASGRVINPLGFEGQCEGGAVMGMGYALHEDFSVPGNPRGITRNFQTYLIPTMADMPDIAVTAMEESEVTGPFGASGIGESVAVTGSAAIMNGVFDAVGIRIRELPCSRETLLREINGNNKKTER